MSSRPGAGVGVTRARARLARLALTERIEQAIARGVATSQIMADEGCDYETVADVRQHLNAVAHTRDVALDLRHLGRGAVA